jgi:hypothetical protein
MRSMLVLLAAMVAAAACGAETGAGQSAPSAAPATRAAPLAAPSNERLYLGDGSVLKVVDGASGQLERTMPAGSPSPDWSLLYSVGASYANLRLQVIDGASGEVRRAMRVPDWASDVRVAANGRWLALMLKPDPKAATSHFQVLDADFAQPPQDVELPGAWAFDGLSGDGKRLYLLQLRAGGSYQVRLYDLASRRLVPGAIADKGTSSTVMSGGAVNSLTSADGQMQLTLYEKDSGGHAFVHVLPIGVALPYAYCVDLPAPGQYWALTAAPDGQRFYAANLLSGALVGLAVQGTDSVQVRSGQLGLAAGRPSLIADVQAKGIAQRTAAAVSGDGSTLFVGAGDNVTRIDAGSLRRGSSIRLGGEQVLDLAAGRSGWLYGTTASGRLLRIDPGTMQLVWWSPPNFKGLSIQHVTAG